MSTWRDTVNETYQAKATERGWQRENRENREKQRKKQREKERKQQIISCTDTSSRRWKHILSVKSSTKDAVGIIFSHLKSACPDTRQDVHSLHTVLNNPPPCV